MDATEEARSYGQTAGLSALDELISPFTAEDFFSSYWSRQPLYVKRQPNNRYYSLFPWEHLKDVLEQHPMLPPRMALLNKGIPVSFHDYLRLDGRGYPARIQPLALLKALNGGASLVINAADGLHAPLRQFLYPLEMLFRMPIQANLYAAWGTEEGFELHWDEQDTIIVQLAGRKRWTMYFPTADVPVKEMKQEVPKPNGTPYFKELINSGECMYVPRGWWHLVEPVGEPALHLTLTLYNPTWFHLVNWLLEENANEVPVFRTDVPRNVSPATVQLHLEELSKRFSAELNQPNLLERFWAWSERRIRVPGCMKLPQDVDRSERIPTAHSAD